MQDLYENLIKDKLKKYLYAKDFINHAEVEIEELKAKKESKMVASYGVSPMFGGGSSQEDKILNINAKIEMLEKNISNSKDIVKEVEYGLLGLSDSEREITLKIYGEKQSWNKIDILKNEYHFSKSRLYGIARKGLEHIALRLYGDA